MKKLLCIVFLTGFIICGCEQQRNQVNPSGKTVKIGVIAPMSGSDTSSGKHALLGIQTALHMRPYLDNGDKVELVIEDNQASPEQTLTALEKLRDQEDVAGVLLMAISDVVLAAVPVADQYKIPILALIATHPDITKNNQYISQLGFDDIYQGTIAALYLRDEMLIDRVAVISDPDNAHYSVLAKAFIQEFTAAGGQLAKHVSVGHEPADFQQILESLRNTSIQFLYLALVPERVVQLARAAEKIGWKPRMMGSDGLSSAILLRHNEDVGLVDGMMATDFFSSVLPKTEYGKKAVSIFKKHFSEPGTTYSGLGCEGTSILLHAMNRCENNTNRECVNSMLRNTEAFDGLFGKIAIHKDGKAERPIYVNVIEDQKMEFRTKVY